MVCILNETSRCQKQGAMGLFLAFFSPDKGHLPLSPYVKQAKGSVQYLPVIYGRRRTSTVQVSGNAQRSAIPRQVENLARIFSHKVMVCYVRRSGVMSSDLSLESVTCFSGS